MSYSLSLFGSSKIHVKLQGMFKNIEGFIQLGKPPLELNVRRKDSSGVFILFSISHLLSVAHVFKANIMHCVQTSQRNALAA